MTAEIAANSPWSGVIGTSDWFDNERAQGTVVPAPLHPRCARRLRCDTGFGVRQQAKLVAAMRE